MQSLECLSSFYIYQILVIHHLKQIPSLSFCSIANILFFSILLAGDILAKSFKWIYAKCCLCRICPKIARRRMMRERKKLRLQTVDRDFPVNLLS